MNKKLYTIRDVLVGYGAVLGTPAILDIPNDQAAKRVVAGCCMEGAQANALNTNPEDKELWCIGEFDQDTGIITPCTPYLVCRALDFYKGGAKDETPNKSEASV